MHTETVAKRFLPDELRKGVKLDFFLREERRIVMDRMMRTQIMDRLAAANSELFKFREELDFKAIADLLDPIDTFARRSAFVDSRNYEISSRKLIFRENLLLERKMSCFLQFRNSCQSTLSSAFFCKICDLFYSVNGSQSVDSIEWRDYSETTMHGTCHVNAV